MPIDEPQRSQKFFRPGAGPSSGLLSGVCGMAPEEPGVDGELARHLRVDQSPRVVDVLVAEEIFGSDADVGGMVIHKSILFLISI